MVATWAFFMDEYNFIEVFTATECHEVMWGGQPCENGVINQCFGDCPCLHHYGSCHGSSSSTLMMEAETGSETLYINSILTRLIPRDYFFTILSNF
jgi:hypothetical protein